MCCKEYRILSRYKKGLTSDDSVWGKKEIFAPSSWDATPRENTSWKKQKRSEAVYVYTDESSVGKSSAEAEKLLLRGSSSSPSFFWGPFASG
jgi:hypothetical protein